MAEQTERLFVHWLSVLGAIAATLVVSLLALGVGAVGIAFIGYAERELGVDLIISGTQINLVGSALTGGIYGTIGMVAGALSAWLITRRRMQLVEKMDPV